MSLRYDLSKIETGVVCPEAGRCAAKFVIEGCKLALAGRVDGISTAPLNKAAMYEQEFVSLDKPSHKTASR